MSYHFLLKKTNKKTKNTAQQPHTKTNPLINNKICKDKMEKTIVFVVTILFYVEFYCSVEKMERFFVINFLFYV